MELYIDTQEKQANKEALDTLWLNRQTSSGELANRSIGTDSMTTARVRISVTRPFDVADPMAIAMRRFAGVSKRWWLSMTYLARD